MSVELGNLVASEQILGFSVEQKTFEMQLNDEIIQLAPKSSSDPCINYFHQPDVTPENDATKLRTVFGTRASTQPHCLPNDNLFEQPTFLPDPFEIVKHTRPHKAAVIRDIEKALLYLDLPEEGRDAQGFLQSSP